MTPAIAGRLLWGRVVAATLIAIVALAACGALGWWQWTRASTTGRVVLPEPSVPIAEVLRPAETVGGALGRQVVVSGTWADVTPVVVSGREVDGTPAELLVRALTVPAEATGAGQEATLAVVAGWRPDGDASPFEPGPSDVTLEGYLRAPEASTASSVPATDPPPGTEWASALATSELAQDWPAPLYGALLVSYQPADGWNALEPLEPTTEVNFRSAAYAVEWWLFGAFAVFVAARWIRDNGRARPEATDPADDAREDHA